MNNNYLNEEKYQNTKNSLSKVGKILLIFGAITLIAGIIMIILGFVGFGKSAESAVNSFYYDDNIGNTTKSVFGSFGMFALGGFVSFLGFGLTIAGVISMVIAHRREITAFTVQGTMPIAKEGMNSIAPAVGNVAESISKGIEKGKIQAREEYENK